MTGAYHEFGGAVICYEYMSPRIDNCIFSNNTTTFGGGAVASSGGGPHFTNCEFTRNQSGLGGAVAALGQSSAIFEDCVFFENSADEGGAMAFDYAGNSTISGCTFAHNQSPQGAHLSISGSPDDTLQVDRSIFAFGGESEGIFWNGDGTLTLACVDIFGNTGGDWVGPISDQETVRGNLHADPQFCWLSNPLLPLSLAASSPCLDKNNPDCGLIGALGEGCGLFSGADDPPPVAGDFRLLPCYPNPFNPRTTISFALKYPADVFLAVYDASGELVRTLASGSFPAGESSAVWQGKNKHGQGVASGIYFARLSVDGDSDVQKMILLQ